jgi:hypothetical protein
MPIFLCDTPHGVSCGWRQVISIAGGSIVTDSYGKQYGMGHLVFQISPPVVSG